MRIARYYGKAGPTLGVVERHGDGEVVIDLVEGAGALNLSWLGGAFRDLRLFLFAGEGGREAAGRVAEARRHAAVPLASVQLLAPFEAGSKILAHVVNYPGHDSDAKVKMPEKPFFFVKASSSIANPGDPIYTHPVSRKLDHEIELAVVVGRAGRDIPAERAYDHIAGYTICNDVSYRDLQMNEDFPSLNQSYGKNWTQAKGLDNACPLGPVLNLSDEVREPYPLQMVCRVNGEVRQQASTAEMVWKVPQLISEVSKGMTLHPGDVILTGTCAGGGLADGRFLKAGDVVECEIEGLGKLTNRVRARTATASVRSQSGEAESGLAA